MLNLLFAFVLNHNICVSFAFLIRKKGINAFHKQDQVHLIFLNDENVWCLLNGPHQNGENTICSPFVLFVTFYPVSFHSIKHICYAVVYDPGPVWWQFLLKKYSAKIL